jgi:hypothetical protein
VSFLPLDSGFLPGTTFSCESSSAGRNIPVEQYRRRGD